MMECDRKDTMEPDLLHIVTHPKHRQTCHMNVVAKIIGFLNQIELDR
jgi:hypothetical protein